MPQRGGTGPNGGWSYLGQAGRDIAAAAKEPDKPVVNFDGGLTTAQLIDIPNEVLSHLYDPCHGLVLSLWERRRLEGPYRRPKAEAPKAPPKEQVQADRW